MPVAVETRALTKAYGTRRVLDGVTLRIEKGSMTVVTGRSGSGKSTLFKLLAGLDRPTSGDVLVDGVSLGTLDDAALSDLRLRHVGIVFQSANLLPDLNVAQNVRLPLDIAGVPRAEANRRARELLDLVGLAPNAAQAPHHLSGGEAQRAAIARALANRPSLLLADEPTGNLDSANARNVMEQFEEVNRTLGTTVVIVTHDSVAIERVPDRLEIRDGAVARAGGA